MNNWRGRNIALVVRILGSKKIERWIKVENEEGRPWRTQMASIKCSLYSDEGMEKMMILTLMLEFGHFSLLESQIPADLGSQTGQLLRYMLDVLVSTTTEVQDNVLALLHGLG